MKVLYLVLYIVAAVCFAVAALTDRVGATGPRRVNLIAVGLLAWVLVPLIQVARTLSDD